MKIKEKKVEQIELFYDLIFVYAISQLTSLISEPINNTIPINNFLTYLITSFVILQAWLYFTNYVNRYGEWKIHDYILACINMIAAIYMTNTIGTNWISMAQPFNISMLIMLLTVVILYTVQAHKEHSMKGAAGNSITILLIVCTIYIIALIFILLNLTNYALLINIIAVITGAFLPFFLKGSFDKSIINFPHLVERFELLTIITFGEAIVGMTHFFDVNNITPIPILIFLIIITMYGAYTIQIHNLVNHHRNERSLRLMFSHYFIVISINLVTVAIELIHYGINNHYIPSGIIITALIIFYLSIMTNKEYYKDEIELKKTEILSMITITTIGALINLVFIENIYAFLIGTLVITIGNLTVLLNKNKQLKKETLKSRII